MATVADQLATFKKIPNGEAQEYFVHSKFDLNPIGSWSYGCYGQIRPFRKGRVSRKPVFGALRVIFLELNHNLNWCSEIFRTCEQIKADYYR